MAVTAGAPSPIPGPVRVRAAGGLVVRDRPEGNQLLIVHRPHRDDWSFPKGKADAGEPDEDCARREVREETGLDCAIECFFDENVYLDHRNRKKRVVYYLMRRIAGELTVNDEVDELDFVEFPEAIRRLTWERDREIARSLADSPLLRAEER